VLNHFTCDLIVQISFSFSPAVVVSGEVVEPPKVGSFNKE